MHAPIAPIPTPPRDHVHVTTITSGPVIADALQVIAFAVAPATTRLRIAVPAGVGWGGAAPGDLGKPALIRTGGRVSAVEWTRPAPRRRTAHGRLALRLRVPAVPFTQLRLDIEQTCEVATAHAADLTVVPARAPGWNRFVVPRALTHDELRRYLGDAELVWRGAAAYSADAATSQLIAMTPGVTVLTAGLERGDEIWVLYAPSRGRRRDT